MLKGKSMLEYKNLFLPNDYEMNDKIIQKYFQSIFKMKKKFIVLFVVNMKNLETLKHHIFSKKTLVLSIICSKCDSKEEKIFKEEKSIKTLKILGFNY